MGENAAHKVGLRCPFAALSELHLVATRLHAHTHTHTRQY